MAVPHACWQHGAALGQSLAFTGRITVTHSGSIGAVKQRLPSMLFLHTLTVTAAAQGMPLQSCTSCSIKRLGVL